MSREGREDELMDGSGGHYDRDDSKGANHVEGLRRLLHDRRNEIGFAIQVAIEGTLAEIDALWDNLASRDNELSEAQTEVERLRAGMKRVRDLAHMMAQGKGVIAARKVGAQVLAITGHLEDTP